MTTIRFGRASSRRDLIKFGAAAGGALALSRAAGGWTPRALAADSDWTAAPDVAKAKGQAADFQTYGMPDDWANYGGVLAAFAEHYGFDLHRTDTDMTSMEEITKYDAEQN